MLFFPTRHKHSQSGFKCMVFYRRDAHVTEIQMGSPAMRLEDACAPDHFDINKLQFVTLLGEFIGDYHVKGCLYSVFCVFSFIFVQPRILSLKCVRLMGCTGCVGQLGRHLFRHGTRGTTISGRRRSTTIIPCWVTRQQRWWPIHSNSSSSTVATFNRLSAAPVPRSSCRGIPGNRQRAVWR